MEKEKKNIAKESKIDEVFREYPETAEIMKKYGLHCIGCMASRFETIEEGAKAHGLDDKEIDAMIEEINKN